MSYLLVILLLLSLLAILEIFLKYAKIIEDSGSESPLQKNLTKCENFYDCGI